jgi:hypothetical protein
MDTSDAQGSCVMGVLKNCNCVFTCTTVCFQSVDVESHSTQFWILIIVHFGLMGPWTLHITGILNITFRKLEMFLKCVLFVIPNEAVLKPSKM